MAATRAATSFYVVSLRLEKPQGEYVETTFYPGWNPEIIDEIQANAEISNIQVGL